MEWTTFAQVLTSAAAGAIGLKLLEFALDHWKLRSESRRSARLLLARHLDPILKAADDLVGKIRSLAESDFADFRHRPSKAEATTLAVRRLATIHHFAQFWARVQILRLESASAGLGIEKAGTRLLNFIYELESQRVRVLDRAWQRAAGDAAMVIEGDRIRPMTLFEFITKHETSAEFQRWFYPLARVLDQSGKAENRQRILVYGIVLHALIDSLDPKHVVTRHRRPWGNKLAKKSKRELEQRVFPVHLPFVRRPRAYTTA